MRSKMLGQVELDSYANKMDFLINEGDPVSLRNFLTEIESTNFINSKLQSYFYYILGTGYSYLANCYIDLWSQDSLGNSVRYFRKATYESGFTALSKEYTSRIHTNLGSAFSKQGRMLEAINEFDRAISINNNPIALLSKGRALLPLSYEVIDQGHALYYQYEAYKLLSDLYKNRHKLFDSDHISSMESDKYINGFLLWGETQYDNAENLPTVSEPPPRKRTSAIERQYINWCTEETLYINDLSELSKSPGTSEDYLCFPDTLNKLNPLINYSDSLALSAAYSEIKHQYAFARFNYFDAINSKFAAKEKPHFSDKHLYLTNSLDYCLYRRDIEMLKVSFRLLYSCFDKLASLLNKYLMLEKNDHTIHFSNIWFRSRQDRRIRDYFLKSENKYFLALYWLSRDINSNEEFGHGYWMDENAQKLADIRNRMEHQSFRVVIDELHKITQQHKKEISEENLQEEILQAKSQLNSQTVKISKEQASVLNEKIADLEHLIKEKDFLKGYPLIITDKELREQTMRIMRIVRYSAIYLALAINHEDQKKERDGIIIGLDVPIL